MPPGIGDLEFGDVALGGRLVTNSGGWIEEWDIADWVPPVRLGPVGQVVGYPTRDVWFLSVPARGMPGVGDVLRVATEQVLADRPRGVVCVVRDFPLSPNELAALASLGDFGSVWSGAPVVLCCRDGDTCHSLLAAASSLLVVRTMLQGWTRVLAEGSSTRTSFELLPHPAALGRARLLLRRAWGELAPLVPLRMAMAALDELVLATLNATIQPFVLAFAGHDGAVRLECRFRPLPQRPGGDTASDTWLASPPQGRSGQLLARDGSLVLWTVQEHPVTISSRYVHRSRRPVQTLS